MAQAARSATVKSFRLQEGTKNTASIVWANLKKAKPRPLRICAPAVLILQTESAVEIDDRGHSYGGKGLFQEAGRSHE